MLRSAWLRSQRDSDDLGIYGGCADWGHRPGRSPEVLRDIQLTMAVDAFCLLQQCCCSELCIQFGIIYGIYRRRLAWSVRVVLTQFLGTSMNVPTADGGVAVESIDLDISCQCAGLGPLFCLFAYRTAAGCQLVSQSCGSA